ncbi:hypothetical protein ABT104_18515 [Streptomyces mobaraensis]|uniref:hypothetical protein n=1 Tax=Streptomyces mobaraensis TaxID=35621 RepID=UPI00331EDDE4
MGGADREAGHQVWQSLGVRTTLDAQFRRDLDEWGQHAQLIVTGTVYNNTGGGTDHAPVVQGRDFSGYFHNALGAGRRPTTVNLLHTRALGQSAAS